MQRHVADLTSNRVPPLAARSAAAPPREPVSPPRSQSSLSIRLSGMAAQLIYEGPPQPGLRACKAAPSHPCQCGLAPLSTGSRCAGALGPISSSALIRASPKSGMVMSGATAALSRGGWPDPPRPGPA